MGVVVATGAAAFVIGLGGYLLGESQNKGSSPPEPDRVVGIYERCGLLLSGQVRDYGGATCDLVRRGVEARRRRGEESGLVVNERFDLDIRAPDGTIRRVQVARPLGEGARLDDPWPPQESKR